MLHYNTVNCRRSRQKIREST